MFKHPFLSNRTNTFIYSFSWLGVAIVHWIFLYYVISINPEIAAIDSLVFNAFFAIIGFGIWFPVSFARFEKDRIIYSLINHLSASLILLMAWCFGSTYVLKSIFENDIGYIDFLDNALPYRLMIGAFYYVMISMIYYIQLYYFKLQEKIENEAQYKSLIKEAELKILRSQLKPHFLFNSLNSISSLTITHPEKAQEMIIKLSEFFRYILAKKDDMQMNSFEQEMNHIELYMEIEKIRFGSRLIFEPEFDKTCAKILVPTLLLQPIVENAIKHGVHNSIEPVIINLKVSCNEDMLKLLIGNNYDPEVHVKKGTGTGLTNIRQRLALIYERHDLMTVSDKNNYFEISINIPIK